MNATPNSLPSEIFKAYDIRGVVGRSLTSAVVRRIGHALGSEAKQRGQQAIIIGRDGRLSGPELCSALAEGVQLAGCNVIDIGQAPTPLVYFASHRLDTQSAVAVTGSHNPPEYNGLKMVIAGETLAGERIQQLRQRILHDRLITDGPGTYQQCTIIDDYVQRVVEDVRLERSLNIIIDCGNGVAGAVAPTLYRGLGCTVTELYCEVDGTFPNHHPDPSQPDNLIDLKHAVSDTGADLGLAFDGDGDRLGVVSSDGTLIWPDRLMILFSRDILSRNPGAQIIFDVKCSRTLPAAIRDAGGIPLMWRTGHSFIKAKLKQTGAALAGEMSGHIFFKERWYGFDDALYTGARLLELLAKDPRDPAAVFAELPDSVNTPELHIEMDEGEHFALMHELIDRARFPGGDISTIDGLRVDFDDGFGLVRPSNTTPLLVLRFEADTQASLERIQDQFRRLITDARPNLCVPF
ncbi:MAG: phosphomannomutase/phosphoglucomutase [Gammaproteobacteria bacterium]|nr:phosphomannomutase/phosphoglucomutase [Gammaproteobacteria bacterium]